MKRHILLWFLTAFYMCLNSELVAQTLPFEADSLPKVFTGPYIDLIERQYRMQALFASRTHQLPDSRIEWQKYKSELKSKIMENAAVEINHDLPLQLTETGIHQFKEYSVRNITFQTRPGSVATANLYVPVGNGPFPAVIAMHGHWPDGKSNPVVQSLGHTLAQNGYVCLVADAFGSGERTTQHGLHEYHGSNLGASLMNIGHTLMGEQISDNIRGVDLLSSLPYVDNSKIGATGASGGGNQTMWLSALDERIKAAMPVVSVGSFESYIMRSNCVCELLPAGLTFTEEAGILAMIAPRALNIATALQDANPTFVYAEMLKSFKAAQPVFTMLGAFDKINYQLFDTGHGYWPEMRQSMLGFFDLNLKAIGNGAAKEEIPFTLLDQSQLMVYKAGNRDSSATSIEKLARQQGAELKAKHYRQSSVDVKNKREQLQKLLGITQPNSLVKTHDYGYSRGWQRIAIETSANTLIPVLVKRPKSSGKGYTVVLKVSGKQTISPDELAELENSGTGVLLADLWGTGENYSEATATFDKSLTRFHTLARASLWLGQTVIGNWVNDIGVISAFISSLDASAQITFQTEKEVGLAALFHEAIYQKSHELILADCPVSYRFDNRQGIDYFGLGIHIPGILQWGDVALAAGLTKGNVQFKNPVSMSGRPVKADELDTVKSGFERSCRLCKKKDPVIFK